MLLKVLFIWLTLIFPLFGLSYVDTQTIYASEDKQLFDLSGNHGQDGMDGRAAEEIYCADSKPRVGLDGEDGHDGEAGFNGNDAYVYYRELRDLKNITLYQSGGLGGKPGIGAQGSYGCNGGAHGARGSDGHFGVSGEYGRIFLFKEGFQIDEVRNSQVISLIDLYKSPITLGQHIWKKLDGAKTLFSPNSDILNSYYKYDSTKTYQVKLEWGVDSFISNFKSTKLAISVKKGQLRINNYKGAVLDYNVSLRGNTFVVRILRATAEGALRSLSFGKLRKSHEKLTLEVIEKFTPTKNVKTRFIISLFNMNRGSGYGELIGQYAIKPKHIIFENKIFYLNIGSLNFPAVFKIRGSKLRIHMSIYRKMKKQTRVFSIKGLFRI